MVWCGKPAVLHPDLSHASPRLLEHQVATSAEAVTTLQSKRKRNNRRPRSPPARGEQPNTIKCMGGVGAGAGAGVHLSTVGKQDVLCY